MAVTIRIFNNANQLASRPIPDNAVTAIQRVLGGATPAETSALYLDFLAVLTREALRQRGANSVQDAQTVTANAAKIAFLASFDSDYPTA